ncbi:MAG: hypothetical protein GYB65_18050 [Chloroflexi bacterium]|nr:hypothetical protein [Chloroflexota bacterium]
MPKRLIALAAGLIMLAWFAPASRAPQVMPTAAQGPDLPPADGEAVLAYILETDPYDRWGSWVEGLHARANDSAAPAEGAVESPHLPAARLYANTVALEALQDFDGHLPSGSLLVREEYQASVDEPDSVVMLHVMYKPENPDDRGDTSSGWLWVQATPDGELRGALASEPVGTPTGEPSDVDLRCTACHTRDTNTDSLSRFDDDRALLVSAAALDAEALVDERCSLCHTVFSFRNIRMDRAAWTSTVDRQINWGAMLNDAERLAVIDYLATRYGP